MSTPGVFEVGNLTLFASSLSLFLRFKFRNLLLVCVGSTAAGEGSSKINSRGMISFFKCLFDFSHFINVISNEPKFMNVEKISLCSLIN